MFRKRVRIGTRSFSLATILLIVTVISAAAWAAYLMLVGTQSLSLTVKAGP
ncbi:unnamed protein product, partial [marine sediment metagenome]